MHKIKTENKPKFKHTMKRECMQRPLLLEEEGVSKEKTKANKKDGLK